MRTYGKIESGFWQNKKIRPLNDEEKLLLLYIYTCSHGNSVGCFILPPGYIAEDMKWPIERVTEHVTLLVSKGFIERDIEANLIRIVGWFDHNTIENINVAKAAAKTILQLPNCNTTHSLIKDIYSLGNKFMNTLVNELANEFGLCFETQSSSSSHNLTLTEPKQEPEPVEGLRVTRESTASPSGKARKDFFEKNDFDAAAACCRSLLGKRDLSLLDKEHLTTWCMKYDFETSIKPLLYSVTERFMKSNHGKKPSSLAYFSEKIKENCA